MTIHDVKNCEKNRHAPVCSTAIKPCSISPGRHGTPAPESPGSAGLETQKQRRGRPARPRMKALGALHKSPAGLVRTGSGGFCILAALKPRGISPDRDPSQNTPLRALKSPMNFLPEGVLSRMAYRFWRMDQAGFHSRVDSQEAELFLSAGRLFNMLPARFNSFADNLFNQRREESAGKFPPPIHSRIVAAIGKL